MNIIITLVSVVFIAVIIYTMLRSGAIQINSNKFVMLTDAKMAEKANNDTCKKLIIAVLIMALIGLSSFMLCAHLTEKEKINVNTCTVEELKTIYGIGDVKANLIVENRPYESIYELSKIDGISEEFARQLKDDLVL